MSEVTKDVGKLIAVLRLLQVLDEIKDGDPDMALACSLVLAVRTAGMKPGSFDSLIEQLRLARDPRSQETRDLLIQAVKVLDQIDGRTNGE